MIPKNAQNPEAAKRLLKFLASQEAQTLLVKDTGRIGVHVDIPMDVYPPSTQKGIKMIQKTEALAQFYDCDTTPEMADKGMDVFMEFWFKPDNIEDILARLDKDRQRIFKTAQ